MREARPGSPVSEAAVLGGAVTRERLERAALAEGQAEAALVRALLAQPLPGFADLVRAWESGGGPMRLDPSLLKVSVRAARLLDPVLMRRERCVPVAIYDDICVLAVEAENTARAVEAVKAALRRSILPVQADAADLEAALANLPSAARATYQGPIPRRDPAVHSRFRDLVLGGTVLDAVPLPAERA